MRIIWKLIKSGLMILTTYTLLSILILAVFRVLPVSSSAFINSKSDALFGIFTPNEYKYQFTPLKSISPAMPLAVIASEDQRFFDHFGFDLEQIEKALKENTRRKRIRGASTISMQLAKNLFLTSGKNFIRKGAEAYFTLLIELVWSKERIIEVYLNIAEMGNQVYGVGAASKMYFNKRASKLNNGQAALLASVLPKPSKRNAAKPSGYMMRRKGEIMKQMNFMGGTEFIKENISY